jgi:hypothetical protein
MVVHVRVPTSVAPAFAVVQKLLARSAMRLLFRSALGLFVFACGTSSKDDHPAPTCEQLQSQIDGCSNLPQTAKDSLGPFCAKASEACRSCLDGKLCGVTEQCDPACGKK